MFISKIKHAAMVCAVTALAGCSSHITQAIKTDAYEVITLDFKGPETSEVAENNPFLNYRLVAEFTNGSEEYQIRGFYDADGNAAETSDDSGNIWRVKFRVPSAGNWQYKINFDQGENIALNTDLSVGKGVYFDGAQGHITANNSAVPAHDVLDVKNGYFYYRATGKPVLKVGANSPENLLGFKEFDGTYRVNVHEDGKEDLPTENLHQYLDHQTDWQAGDVQWQNGKGKGLIGGINYLASHGMNAMYFLTMNIGGDGKDVWPYVDHKTLDRFDVSKLAQWEKVFQHMEDKKIIMHFILQETENELLFDNGDTGPQRQLYLQELFARFAHHAGIVWNIGEENGPVDFSPEGQSPDQVKAMADFINQADPYNHPLFLHTHASGTHKRETLTEIMGYKGIDGLSFQVDEPHFVAQHLDEWFYKALRAGHSLAITMDEVGHWRNGAMPDNVSKGHDNIRKKVLWPSFMKGATGVEWYSGYDHPHNDLSTESWRVRENLWQQTAIARNFFEEHNVTRLTTPCVSSYETIFCRTNDDTSKAIIYIEQQIDKPVNLALSKGSYQYQWFNPKTGKYVAQKAELKVPHTYIFTLPKVPDENQQDWALVLSKK